MNLSITSESNADVTCVELAGRISQRDLSPFDEPLRDLLGENAYDRKVLLDMESVEALDSSGVSWLLTCHKRFQDAGGKLVIHNVSPIAKDVLKILNLHKVLHLANDQQEARQLAEGDAE
jgi:anti-anti-sigma factor